MRRELLAPLAVLLILLVAAGSSLAVVSLGGGSDDDAALEMRQGAEPAREQEREQEPDRPPSRAEPSLPRLRQQPFVGIALSEKDGDIVVERVVPGSPAARAGIQEGDVIEAVDDTSVQDPAEVAEIVRGTERGDILTFHVRRDGDEHEIPVQVRLRPAPSEAGGDGPRSSLLDEFVEFFPLPNLRERLGELFERFIGASITFLEDEGEQVTLRLVAGTIGEVSDDGIVVSPSGGLRLEELAVTDDTWIVRGLHRADANDLEPGDRVLVLVRDESREALAILAFPAHEEESEG